MSNTSEKVRVGTWSVVDNKIRISYPDGVESALFEDTASVSFQRVDKQAGMNLLVGMAVLLFFMFVGLSSLSGSSSWILFWFVVTVAMFAINSLSPKYDVVSIETVGGKIIRFRCELGLGAETMERIEAAKRNWQNS